MTNKHDLTIIKKKKWSHNKGTCKTCLYKTAK